MRTRHHHRPTLTVIRGLEMCGMTPENRASFSRLVVHDTLRFNVLELTY